MPVGDPDLFSGRFSRTFMHQDLSTSLRKKSLNSGLILVGIWQNEDITAWVKDQFFVYVRVRNSDHLEYISQDDLKLKCENVNLFLSEP